MKRVFKFMVVSLLFVTPTICEKGTVAYATDDNLPSVPKTFFTSKPTPTPAPILGRYSEKQIRFLIGELERTIKILAQEPMVPPADTLPAMLEKNNLVSWFDLERPEPQGIYYLVLGLPIQNQSLLNRTKSEFFQMSQEEREKLKVDLQPVLEKLQQQLPKKPPKEVKNRVTSFIKQGTRIESRVNTNQDSIKEVQDEIANFLKKDGRVEFHDRSLQNMKRNHWWNSTSGAIKRAERESTPRFPAHPPAPPARSQRVEDFYRQN